MKMIFRVVFENLLTVIINFIVVGFAEADTGKTWFGSQKFLAYTQSPNTFSNFGDSRSKLRFWLIEVMLLMMNQLARDEHFINYFQRTACEIGFFTLDKITILRFRECCITLSGIFRKSMKDEELVRRQWRCRLKNAHANLTGKFQAFERNAFAACKNRNHSFYLKKVGSRKVNQWTMLTRTRTSNIDFVRQPLRPFLVH